MNKNFKKYVPAIIAVAVVFVIIMLFNNLTATKQMIYSDVISLFKEDNVKSFQVDYGKGELTLKLRNDDGVDKKYISQTSDGEKTVITKMPNIEYFLKEIAPYKDKYNEEHPDDIIKEDQIKYEVPWIYGLLPYLILGIVFVAVWFSLMKRMSAGLDGGVKTMNFGKAKIQAQPDDKKKVTFADVAGCDEEKEELHEIVDFLKSPKKFQELGARIPKGVLLVGPPGTGKTLLARAVAGEAGVPFFSMSGSDFVEMFVGVGASRVRDLFEQAKKNSPCIIFIDEIDAVGRHRGAGLGGGHDEREQTLNQLLVEMDGFGAYQGIIVIAATNRPDILDPAIMRPGRFDRKVTVSYPDTKGREDILKVHSRGKPLGPDVDLKIIACSTAGFTGADLENLLNEAALLAARKDKKAITMQEIEEATVKVMMGTEKKSRIIPDKDKRITAFHEAGHAVTGYLLPTQPPVHQISIIPRGMAAGYTMSVPTEEKVHMSKNEMKETIVSLLAGRVAEALVIKDITSGASNDIERATKLARDMVTKYGMSTKLGPVNYASSEGEEVFLARDMGHAKNYSDSIAFEIDEEVSKIITTAYNKAEKLLTENMDKLELVSKVLIKKEKIEAKEFEQLMTGELTEEQALGELADTKEVEETSTTNTEENGSLMDSVVGNNTNSDEIIKNDDSSTNENNSDSDNNQDNSL